MLRFQELAYGPEVPSNFLPAALPALLGRGAEAERPKALQAGAARPEAAERPRAVEPREVEPPDYTLVVDDDEAGLKTLSISLGSVADGEVLTELLGGFARGGRTPVPFGPRVRRGEPTVLPLPEEGADDGEGREGPAQVGLIDAGIAFWNPAFGGAFKSVGFLEFDRPPNSAPNRVMMRELPGGDLAAMVARGNTLSGDRLNRTELAAIHDEGVHAARPGGPPLLGPGDLSHGTAMAGLVLEANPEACIHGLELPRRVLLDSTGGTLRGVIDAAVRGVVNLAVRNRPPGAPARVVVLLSFGFLGGPHPDGAGGEEAAVLRRLRRTIELYRDRRGIDVRIVVPMGNHLQDQAHARLPPPAEGEPPRWLDWRTMPDDHSANTVELFHDEGVPDLAIETPSGAFGVRPGGGGTATHLVVLDGRPIGAIRTEPMGGGRSRTVVSLAPTASRAAGVALAPFGRWRLRLEGMGALAWIQRDDSGFDDRSAPRRRSWFEDPPYRARDPDGLPGIGDAAHPGGLVRRQGSASLLATALHEAILPVAALWTAPAVAAPRPAAYSGAFLPGHPRSPAEAGVDAPGPFGGRPVLGTGTGRTFRARGSSIAAALVAGKIAAP